jgi:hypothetical protein
MFAAVSVILVVLAWLFFVLVVAAKKDKTKTEKITILDDRLNSFVPNIQIAGAPVLHDVNIGHVDAGKYVLSHICVIASISFDNKPKFPNQNNSAKNVRAEIDFLDEHKRILVSNMQGRWQGLQPNEINTSDRTVLESTNMPNNGAQRWLDLVMKYPEDQYCHGYNNASYGLDYFLNPSLLISQKRFFIHIRLRGEYVPDNVFELEVITRGVGDTFQMRYSEEWLRIKDSKATKHPNRPMENPQKRKSSPKKTSSRRWTR